MPEKLAVKAVRVYGLSKALLPVETNWDPEPCRTFLSKAVENLKEEVEVHCLGGFVVTMLYGLARSTFL
jgi:hypothetical protein